MGIRSHRERERVRERAPVFPKPLLKRLELLQCSIMWSAGEVQSTVSIDTQTATSVRSGWCLYEGGKCRKERVKPQLYHLTLHTHWFVPIYNYMYMSLIYNYMYMSLIYNYMLYVLYSKAMNITPPTGWRNCTAVYMDTHYIHKYKLR